MQEKRFISITALTANLPSCHSLPKVDRSALLRELREVCDAAIQTAPKPPNKCLGCCFLCKIIKWCC